MPMHAIASGKADNVQRQLPYPHALTNQPVLVTGASSGIGRAIALGLAQAGADIAVNYHSHAEQAEEVAQQIEAFGQRALVLQGNVAREDDVERMFTAAGRSLKFPRPWARFSASAPCIRKFPGPGM